MTIAKIKALFLEELGDLATIEQFHFERFGKKLADNVTLGSIDIVNGWHLPLMATFTKWTVMYHQCPVCIKKCNGNGSDLSKYYWHHPGDDKAEYRTSKSSEGYIVECMLDKVRCDGCKTECKAKNWKWKCPNHDYQKVH